VRTRPEAALFVDGEPRGTTPVHLPLVAGAHRVVLVSEHQRLQKQAVQVTGPTTLDLALEPARLPAGAAGLKVRCRSQGELRIFIDGEDTGLSCPNAARIPVAPGTHKLGLYSPRTDKLVELDQTVNDDPNHSTRVYVKY
jgi:hypothetical protein